jgi:ornithine carbamoyltransferase
VLYCQVDPYTSIDSVTDLTGRDFLRVADWSRDELTQVLDLADRLKDEQRRHEQHHLLPGRAIGLIFEKPSLRTRVSFEVGIAQLGGIPVHLPGAEIGLGHREPTRDLGYVLIHGADASARMT